MISMDTVAADGELADALNRAADGKERILLCRNGQAVAAVVPLEDVQFLEELEDRIDADDARAALDEAKANGTIPLEQLRAELGL
jgi:antitoxin (DNA-binding transcriptional repressor) of toxin-antitoxin stability system